MMVLAFAAHHCQVPAAPTKTTTTTLTFAPSEIEKKMETIFMTTCRYRVVERK